MTLQSSTLRPGLLVGLKTHVNGGVHYHKQMIEHPHISDEGERAVWQMHRTVADPKEYERAKQVRSKARSIVSGVCANSAFGLLCPEAFADKLEGAIAQARALAEEFNATAAISRVTVYVITGRIAPDDVEAVRAINSEIRGLLDDMERGVRNLDVQVIREAASKARSLGSMLTPGAAARVSDAIDVARATARKIVKAGEGAAQEIDKQAMSFLATARTAFLDLDDARELNVPEMEGRGIDLAPPSIEDIATSPAGWRSPLFEME